jgi:hypothetical protein
MITEVAIDKRNDTANGLAAPMGRNLPPPCETTVVVDWPTVVIVTVTESVGPGTTVVRVIALSKTTVLVAGGSVSVTVTVGKSNGSGPLPLITIVTTVGLRFEETPPGEGVVLGEPEPWTGFGTGGEET